MITRRKKLFVEKNTLRYYTRMSAVIIVLCYMLLFLLFFVIHFHIFCTSVYYFLIEI